LHDRIGGFGDGAGLATGVVFFIGEATGNIGARIGETTEGVGADTGDGTGLATGDLSLIGAATGIVGTRIGGGVGTMGLVFAMENEMVRDTPRDPDAPVPENGVATML
jgi:hypothetical protein